MIVLGVVLLAAAAVPSLVLAGLLHADAQTSAVQRTIAAMHVRSSVVPREEPHQEERYPARQAPTDLGRAYDRPGLPWRLVNSPGMSWMTTGYLRARVPVPWPHLQRKLAGERALTEDTQFTAIVRSNWDTGERAALEWRCDSCRDLVEYERRCQSCSGCACPCTLIGQPGMVTR